MIEDLLSKLRSLIVKLIEMSIPPKIQLLAELIKEYEGYAPPGSWLDGKFYPEGTPAYKNNNPGNCRYSSVGYSPLYGEVKKDPNGFAVFRTYDLGWLYLNRLLLNWARFDRHDWTILQLMRAYAPGADGNDPEAYASFLVKRLGVTPDTKMGELLS